MWNAFYDLWPGNGVGPILTAPEPTWSFTRGHGQRERLRMSVLTSLTSWWNGLSKVIDGNKINKVHKTNPSRSSVLLIPRSNSQVRSASRERWNDRAAFIVASLRSLSSFTAFICSNCQHTAFVQFAIFLLQCLII